MELTADFPYTEHYSDFLKVEIIPTDTPLFCVLGSIIAAGALWITVASVRNVAQSRNNTHHESLRQMAAEKKQLEA
jgi:hypothetical protein